jgi:predicted peptidase
MNLIRISLLSLSLLCVGCMVTPAAETGFLDRQVTVNGEVHRYQIHVPDGYDAAEEWPVILFLHGAGERGNDGIKPSQVGLGPAMELNAERWPAIALFPQVPDGESWQGPASEVAIAALDATMEEFSIDSQRQYLTGLSLGGNGTWYIGYQHTDRFAALVAVCGFVDLGERFPGFLSDSSDSFAELANQLAAKPIWIVHGDADVVVPVEQSRNMASALEAVAANYHYTELPGINHNSWDAAYSNEELISWLFEQRLN